MNEPLPRVGPVEGTADRPSALAELEAGRLAVRAVVGVLLFLVALAGGCFVFKAQVLAGSAAFVEVAGGPGVFLAWFLLDLSPVPLIPQDVFSTLGVIGGLDFWEAAAWSSAGSLLGGLGSFLLGGRLAHMPRIYRLLVRGRGRRLYDLAHRFGGLVMAAGALLPIPFGSAAWCVGAAQLRPRTYLLVSLLRVPRILFYLWLFERGAVNALG